MKTTYYIVQTSPDTFVRQDGEKGRDADAAARLSLPQARSVFRKECRAAAGDADISNRFGRRFPRVIKVTRETKTIMEQG